MPKLKKKSISQRKMKITTTELREDEEFKVKERSWQNWSKKSRKEDEEFKEKERAQQT